MKNCFAFLRFFLIFSKKTQAKLDFEAIQTKGKTRKRGIKPLFPMYANQI